MAKYRLISWKRQRKQQAWNKGLTAETDIRVKKNLISALKTRRIKGRYIYSFLQLRSSTRRKIIAHCDLKCLVCGWDGEICDIHHIHGKKIKGAHNNKNLTYICPNCHRLVHMHKIPKSRLTSLAQVLPTDWKQLMYKLKI